MIDDANKVENKQDEGEIQFYNRLIHTRIDGFMMVSENLILSTQKAVRNLEQLEARMNLYDERAPAEQDAEPVEEEKEGIENASMLKKIISLLFDTIMKVASGLSGAAGQSIEPTSEKPKPVKKIAAANLVYESSQDIDFIAQEIVFEGLPDFSRKIEWTKMTAQQIEDFGKAPKSDPVKSIGSPEPFEQVIPEPAKPVLPARPLDLDPSTVEPFERVQPTPEISSQTPRQTQQPVQSETSSTNSPESVPSSQAPQRELQRSFSPSQPLRHPETPEPSPPSRGASDSSASSVSEDTLSPPSSQPASAPTSSQRQSPDASPAPQMQKEPVPASGTGSLERRASPPGSAKNEDEPSAGQRQEVAQGTSLAPRYGGLASKSAVEPLRETRAQLDKTDATRVSHVSQAFSLTPTEISSVGASLSNTPRGQITERFEHGRTSPSRRPLSDFPPPSVITELGKRKWLEAPGVVASSQNKRGDLGISARLA